MRTYKNTAVLWQNSRLTIKESKTNANANASKLMHASNLLKKSHQDKENNITICIQKMTIKFN